MWRQSTCQRLYTGNCFNSVSLHRTRTSPWIMGGQVMRLANTGFQLRKIYSVLTPCHVGEWDTASLVLVQHQATPQGHYPWFFLKVKKGFDVFICSPDCSVFICNCKIAPLNTRLPLHHCALTHCRQHVSARCQWVTWWHGDVTVTKHSWAEEREQQSVRARWDRSNAMNVEERNWNWIIDLIVPISNRHRKIPSASYPWVDAFMRLCGTGVFFLYGKKTPNLYPLFTTRRFILRKWVMLSRKTHALQVPQDVVVYLISERRHSRYHSHHTTDNSHCREC